ncbi:MAG: hypothetical protein GWP59_06490 [Chlamydiales bacterium]|nr:hypothetical protein [Chlamydiales bacterium]NCF71332.1 hypothetical protein [Chlamydiales bacterium]
MSDIDKCSSSAVSNLVCSNEEAETKQEVKLTGQELRVKEVAEEKLVDKTESINSDKAVKASELEKEEVDTATSKAQSLADEKIALDNSTKDNAEKQEEFSESTAAASEKLEESSEEDCEYDEDGLCYNNPYDPFYDSLIDPPGPSVSPKLEDRKEVSLENWKEVTIGRKGEYDFKLQEPENRERLEKLLDIIESANSSYLLPDMLEELSFQKLSSAKIMLKVILENVDRWPRLIDIIGNMANDIVSDKGTLYSFQRELVELYFNYRISILELYNKENDKSFPRSSARDCLIDNLFRMARSAALRVPYLSERFAELLIDSQVEQKDIERIAKNFFAALPITSLVEPEYNQRINSLPSFFIFMDMPVAVRVLLTNKPQMFKAEDLILAMDKKQYRLVTEMLQNDNINLNKSIKTANSYVRKQSLFVYIYDFLAKEDMYRLVADVECCVNHLLLHSQKINYRQKTLCNIGPYQVKSNTLSSIALRLFHERQQFSKDSSRVKLSIREKLLWKLLKKMLANGASFDKKISYSIKRSSAEGSFSEKKVTLLNFLRSQVQGKPDRYLKNLLRLISQSQKKQSQTTS